VLRYLVLLVLEVCFISPAQAVTISFENIYSSLNKENTNPIPANYAGLSWSSKFRLITIEYTENVTSGIGYRNGRMGNVVAYTSGAAGSNFVELSSNTAFDFTGAYITSAWKFNQDVLLTGYRNGAVVHQTTIYTSCDKAYWFNFDFSNIDRLVIAPGTMGTNYYSNDRGNHLAIDNITIIPEPISLLLLGAGSLLLMSRKNKPF